MTASNFEFPTSQVATLLNTTPNAINASRRRNGHFRGIVPRKGAAGRLFWPRGEVLRATGSVPVEGRRVIQMGAYFAFIEQLGLPVDDDIITLIGTALLNERYAEGREAMHVVDELELVLKIVRAAVARLDQVEDKLTARDQAGAVHLLGLIGHATGTFAVVSGEVAQ